MTSTLIYGVAAVAITAIALHGTITASSNLRRIVALNLLGAATFLLLGMVARRGATADLPVDPIPQALVITGIVVAFAGTALAVALLRRLAETEEGARARDDRHG